LKTLQWLAKDCADKENLRIVFVSSEGNGPQLLQKNSAWSRAQLQEIGDISDNKAIEFLVEKKKFENDEAKKIVNELTGGRMLLLQNVVKTFYRGKNYEEIEKEMLTETGMIFESAGLLDKTPQHDAGIKLIEALLKSKTKSITSKELAKLVPEPDIRGKLLSQNVFALHPSNRTITFQSRMIETYVKKELFFKE